jgi:hypothetical protein
MLSVTAQEFCNAKFSAKYASGVILNSDGTARDSNKDGKADIGCFQIGATGRVVSKGDLTCINESCFRCSNKLVTGSDASKCNSSLPLCPSVSKSTLQAIIDSSDYSRRKELASYYKYGSTYYNASANANNSDNNACYLSGGALKNHFDFSTTDSLNNAPSVGYCADLRVNPAYCLCAQANLAYKTACGEVKRWIDAGEITNL